METKNSAIIVKNGSYGVNRDHIVVKGTEGNFVTDLYEQALAATTKLEGVNLALFGLAALDPVDDKPGCFRAAPNATLINEGIIDVYVGDVVKKYREFVKKDARSQEGKYRFIKVFALLCGKDSMVINNGVVNIHCDYELDEECPVYTQVLYGGENSTIINNGEIHVIGNGSYNTHVRTMAVPANNMTLLNNGLIDVTMERAATIRCMATSGTGGSLTNYGKIHVEAPGRIMTMGRFASTTLLNAGEIDLVSVATFIENKVAFLYQSYPLACAFYEHSLPNKTALPPIVNSGTVKVHLKGSEASTDKAVAFGLYSELTDKDEKTHVYDNTGSITVTKSGPYDFQVAELGANVQSAKDAPFNIEIRRWKTKKRDFAKTKDLFVCGSGIFDLTHAEFLDENGEKLSSENVVFQNEENAKRGDTFEVKK
jgi:hypothetical protein